MVDEKQQRDRKGREDTVPARTPYGWGRNDQPGEDNDAAQKQRLGYGEANPIQTCCKRDKPGRCDDDTERQRRMAPTQPEKQAIHCLVLRFSRPDEDFRHCIRGRFLLELVFDAYRGKEILPGEALQSDAELDAHIRDHAESANHLCGTCKMGSPDDMSAMVDSECRLIGVQGLQVADSSIFPVSPTAI